MQYFVPQPGLCQRSCGRVAFCLLAGLARAALEPPGAL